MVLNTEAEEMRREGARWGRVILGFFRHLKCISGGLEVPVLSWGKPATQ